MRSALKKLALLITVFIIVSITIYSAQVINTQKLEKSQASTPIFNEDTNGEIATNKDLSVEGEFRVIGKVFFDRENISIDTSNGKVLSMDELGRIILVDDQQGVSQVNNYITEKIETTEVSTVDLPFRIADDNVGLGIDDPSARFHVRTGEEDVIGLIVQGQDGQDADLSQWQTHLGQDVVSITADGKIILDNSAGHQIEIRPSGDTGYLSSSGGSIFIENTNNIGTGIGIYSNAGADALGNMINVKVDNPLYDQAAFYMNYDGISNAVEIVSNANDTSSNALAVTGNNTQDSTVGIIGYESGRGTVKISHYKPSSSDANASALSIDLKGSGTAAQGIYVDSTEAAGTTGNLLRLRNQTLDRFVVSSLGSVTIGRNGTNTSLTKTGNTSGDEFFIGTNGAFRVQRSATDSEAFRTQVNGDTQGRWLGTSDGKLKFGSGSATQDVTLQRTGTELFQLGADIHVTGNLGVGTGTFNASADKVLTFANGTAPSGSVADGVQLWAEDVAASSELRVRDEAGNITTLSPHNFSLINDGPSEELAWAYYSEKDNLAINADITKALRVLERLSGEKLIYIKNLETDELVTTQVSEIVAESVTPQEFSTHVSIVDNVWKFISDITFKARAIFENYVEFLADATFRGHLSVSADTAGNMLISKGVKRFKVKFTKDYATAPIVYASTESDLKFKIENISVSGFEISFENYLPDDTYFKWFALESNNSSNFEILERSE